MASDVDGVQVTAMAAVDLQGHAGVQEQRLLHVENAPKGPKSFEDGEFEDKIVEETKFVRLLIFFLALETGLICL